MGNRMNPNYAASSEPQPNRSTFNVSESHKHTWNVSNIIPVYWDILYPGEVRRGKTRLFIRMSNPLQYPLMDNAYVTIHVFSVAMRNLWDNFRKFWGERENPADSIDYTIPVCSGTITSETWGASQRLFDHLGVPYLTGSNGTNAAELMALVPRAYVSIYNHWYRDPSIQQSQTLPKGDGPDDYTQYQLKQRGKRWDYFTNVLPAPQRGDSISIGGEVATDAPTGGNIGVWSATNSSYRTMDTDATLLNLSSTGSGAQGNVMYPNTTINELRNAVAIQQFLERDNRAGQQFGDLIKAHYGATFTDAKYMPVFIAGGRAPFIFSTIANSAADSGTTPNALGELGAIGTSVFEGASFTYRAEEPEILMICCTVDADLTYQNGLNRKWSYRTRYDFMHPEFEGIGDQALLNKELYYTGTLDGFKDQVFGYTPRYEECRTGVNRLHGEFLSNYPQPLDSWHLAQDFTSRPALNSGYIISAPPFDRVMVNADVDNILADFHFEQIRTIPLSVRGIPGLTRL
ncbi:major capsid protein [Microviridae sp.]|nr:major capsid protein [Microviridae sp.]